MKSSQRRILFARPADASNFNAQAKNVQNILRHWQSSEFRPAVFSFFPPDEIVAANGNVDIIRVAPDRLWRAKVFAAYLRRFDAVFCPGVHHFADWAALKTRAWCGCRLPVIATIEGLLGIDGDPEFDRKYSEIAGHPTMTQKIPRVEWRRDNDLFMMAEHLIAISPFLARMAAARYGEKVSVLPLGVDTTLFRRDAWVPRARPRIIGAGTVYARKRPESFVELAAKFPNADFVWFGDGDLRASLVAEIARRGLRNLQFPGAAAPERLAKEMAASDILVLPSFAEGVPKVTQEAAAAGLAQIIFGFYEASTVVDGENGFVVWSDDELFDRLSQLIADSARIERMGRAGRRMAEAWSWDVVAPQWERRIVAICSRGRAH